jgi:hypothetical protein
MARSISPAKRNSQKKQKDIVETDMEDVQDSADDNDQDQSQVSGEEDDHLISPTESNPENPSRPPPKKRGRPAKRKMSVNMPISKTVEDGTDNYAETVFDPIGEVKVDADGKLMGGKRDELSVARRAKTGKLKRSGARN